MNFLNTGIPIGQYWGITVRLHFTLLIFAYYRVTSYSDIGYGLLVIVGFWGSILLHEFGHALAARWCDGECDEILLWPLGGLAYCRPAFHPTAHLITTVAGPFVTLVLWLFFWGLLWFLENIVPGSIHIPYKVTRFVAEMRGWNLWLLIFNVCVPAFPMDGGRMLRDTLWHWMSAETATGIAVKVSQVIAILAVAWAIYTQNYWIILLAGFILLQAMNEKQIVGFEARGAYQFSVRERLQRGRRRRSFHKAVQERTAEETDRPFHTCAECGQTERDSQGLEFRVCDECANGEEYCSNHLDQHAHR